MLENVILFILSTIVVLIVCRMVIMKWLRSENRFTAEEIDNLTFWEKVTYAFTNFFSRVDHSKDYPTIEIEKKCSGYKQ